jgi:hypothetical protein
MTGQRFGRLTVLRFAGVKWNSSSWLCQCDCGNTVEPLRENLTNGQTTSCGCFRREFSRDKALTHGHTAAIDGERFETPEYATWSRIKRRCFNQNDKDYPDYGGRGITICDEWRDNFQAFFDYVGKRPSRVHSIDRFPDKDGDYRPGNVRWATPSQQARNRRTNRIVHFMGREMALAEACEIAGMKSHTVAKRMAKGWSAHRALTEPLDDRWPHAC